MTVLAIKESLEKFISRVNSVDGIVLTVGICSLVVGVLVDIFVLRLICLLLVILSAALVYGSLYSKNREIQRGMKSADPLFHSQQESDVMKKLVFDDFQSQSGGRFVVEEVYEEVAMDQTQTTIVNAQANVLDSVPVNSPLTGAMSIIPEVKQIVREFHISDFFDIDSDIFKGDAEPRTEFDFLLNKTLGAIKEVLFAHTVAFFWANREKGQMVMEARITDDANFISSRRFSMGHDLVSKVAASGKPELITEVNPLSENELIRYYESTASIKSFAGVPVFFSKFGGEQTLDQPVAVIAVDSLVEDAFGTETLVLLGQFTKLISALVKSYTDKYDLLLESELLRSMKRLQERIRNDCTLNTIVQILSEETSKLLNWDFLSVVLYDEAKHSWVAKKIVNRSSEAYIITEQAVDFPESIVGQTIRNNGYSLVDNLETAFSPRYFKGEKIEVKGSFISVPISSANKCYGALSLESRAINNFSRQNVDILYRLTAQVATALEIIYMNDIIREYVIVDDLTGVYSKKFFMQKMGEELLRADDSGTELTMLFITVDKSKEITERFDREGFERVMVTLSKVIRASVRSYDLVGRYEDDRFAILLINTAANDAYLWAEKIRKNVAAHVMNLDGRSISVTISAGLCGALEGMRKEELVGNTLTVLNKAAETGGNAVRVF